MSVFIPTANETGPRPHLEPEGWRRAGISRSHAYELISQGRFPRPVKVGRASRFVAAEIDAWIEARVADRDAAAMPREA